MKSEPLWSNPGRPLSSHVNPGKAMLFLWASVSFSLSAHGEKSDKERVGNPGEAYNIVHI